MQNCNDDAAAWLEHVVLHGASYHRLGCHLQGSLRVPLLKRLADFQLAAVANMLESFSGKAGEVVFEQGGRLAPRESQVGPFRRQEKMPTNSTSSCRAEFVGDLRSVSDGVSSLLHVTPS